MKSLKTFTLFILLLPAGNICAQDTSKIFLNDTTLLYTEEMPEYPGGVEALKDYLKSNINYPRQARDSGIQGKIKIRFVVDVDGWIREPEVIRIEAFRIDSTGKTPLPDSLAAPLVVEALRVVRFMRPWKPGKQQGKPVRVYYTLPVTFVIED